MKPLRALLGIALCCVLASCNLPAAQPTATPAPTAVPLPSSTPVPVSTPTSPPPTLSPTRTTVPTATRTLAPTPTATRTVVPTATRVPWPVPASARPTPKSGSNLTNGVFDVVIIVDKKAPEVKREDAVRVFELAARELAARTGEWMRLVDVVYGMERQVTGNEYTEMSNLAGEYLKKNPNNPPDGIILFSDTYTCKNAGGFSLSYKPPIAFQNEYRSPRSEVGNDKVYLAVVEFQHQYARCGYGDPNNTARQGAVSIDGECFNQAGVTCVQSGDLWVCPNSLQDAFRDHDLFLAMMIDHEFTHPFGIDPVDLNLDHFAASSCTKRGGVTQAQYDAVMAGDRYDAQRYLGLCPDVWPRFHR